MESKARPWERCSHSRVMTSTRVPNAQTPNLQAFLGSCLSCAYCRECNPFVMDQTILNRVMLGPSRCTVVHRIRDWRERKGKKLEIPDPLGARQEKEALARIERHMRTYQERRSAINEIDRDAPPQSGRRRRKLAWHVVYLAPPIGCSSTTVPRLMRNTEHVLQRRKGQGCTVIK